MRTAPEFPVGQRPLWCRDCSHTQHQHDREARTDGVPGAVAICRVCECRTTNGFLMVRPPEVP